MEDLAARGALLVGILIVLSRLAKAALERLNLPDLLGYLFIGMALRLVEGTGLLRFVDGPQVLSFLAQLGIVALLFRIGLECTPKNLLRRLSGATRIWIANITLSLGAVLGVALFLLDWALLPSLFAAVALTATGIGVSVRIWRHRTGSAPPKGHLCSTWRSSTTSRALCFSPSSRRWCHSSKPVFRPTLSARWP
ncbi:cation:proton antiporter [Salinibacter ruber]|uniref:cation:proton antiporter n=1 Tax=Salinibacter ruber TaxID=146919 RepID=UPI00207351BF|nr:cation:proton antiporter [Salinibacter ruber]